MDSVGHYRPGCDGHHRGSGDLLCGTLLPLTVHLRPEPAAVRQLRTPEEHLLVDTFRKDVPNIAPRLQGRN